MSGCATQDSPKGGVADVPQCRQAANAVAAADFYTRLDFLRTSADAYSVCMQEHGYVFDEAESEGMRLHKEQVQNSRAMGGDPGPLLAIYREELRLNPALWRQGTR